MSHTDGPQFFVQESGTTSAGAWRGFFGAISAAEALLSGLAEFAGDALLHKADELAARRRRGVGLGTEQVLAGDDLPDFVAVRERLKRGRVEARVEVAGGLVEKAAELAAFGKGAFVRLEAVDEFALFLKNLNDVADLVFGRVHLEGEAAESAAVSLNPVLGAHEVNNLDHVVAGPLEAFGKLCNCNESLAFVVGEVNQHAEAEVCKSC